MSAKAVIPLLDLNMLIDKLIFNKQTILITNYESQKIKEPFRIKKAYPIKCPFANNKNKHLCIECLFPNKKEPNLARCDTVGIMGTAAGIAGIIGAQKTINFLLKFDKNINILTLVEAKSLLISNIILKKNNKCKLIKIKKRIN